MPAHKQTAGRVLLGVIGLLFSLFVYSSVFASEPSQNLTAASYSVSLPFITDTASASSRPMGKGWLTEVNYYRANAGVPPVTSDPVLNNNCMEHARYMAENNDLTHNQNPNLPYASPAGQRCAERANAWLGSAFDYPYWVPEDSVEGWVSSVGHRLWLLYPTTPTFGYGFYTAENNRAGAALDVLSRTNFDADAAYANWPVRYPGQGETNVPNTQYPITLNWAYFGPSPTLGTTRLTTSNGRAIAHEANAALPAGHKGIQILPTEPLPEKSTIIVSVTGTYNGAPFSYTWQFSTSGPSNAYP